MTVLVGLMKISECAIRELENDCDTLENEANRLLSINKDLRSNMLNGNGKISDELGLSRSSASGHDHVTDQSFAAEIEESENETSNLERPGPEGKGSILYFEINLHAVGI